MFGVLVAGLIQQWDLPVFWIMGGCLILLDRYSCDQEASQWWQKWADHLASLS